ncbi:hypothetical protein SHKM778_79050 [Streptomyces sp. KM77-8]|uniref:Uncharacterized protein n=1 Tax=Streptomyces haneummycinicus TaxID=3074435 RepID=A0AAT9HVI2_9ACTN
MGDGGEFAQGVAGHDAVLVVAEQALERLHVPGQVRGGGAECGRGGLGGVAGAFGLLAGVVEGVVAVRAGREVEGAVDEGGESAEVLAYGLGEDLVRLGRGLPRKGGSASRASRPSRRARWRGSRGCR